MIQAVSVVPMLAPMMTDDDCTAQVTIVPVSIPLRRLPVMRANMCLKLGPANFCKASLIVFMP